MNILGNIFDLSSVTAPHIVQVFSALRQSSCQLNELNYPELRCHIADCDEELIGDTASKLTMALSIHLECFLGLTCRELDEGNATELSARFSHLHDANSIKMEIDLKAADIIDTLMALY